MSYPPPPGALHSSLPPRPPPSKISGFKPAFSPAQAHGPSAPPPSTYSSAPSYSSAPTYSAAPATQYGGTTTYPSYPQGQMSAAGYGAQQYPQTSYQQPQTYYGAAPQSAASYNTPPQIRNPFPAPSAATTARGGDDYDPDMAAQIAQWQSAYVRDPNNEGAAPSRSTTGPPGTGANASHQQPAPTTEATGEKKKTVVRQGGGQKWTDDTLVEWDPSHLRLFVGNLAGETTDESLHKAFSRWKSLQKARVIRDKVTSKSRGFGFVSFSDPDEFFQAAKEMNGKYIQSHPVVVRKSTTEIKVTTVKEKSGHGKGKWKDKKNKNRSGNGGGGSGREGSFEPGNALGPMGGGGVSKPGQKTKNGLKLLG